MEKKTVSQRTLTRKATSERRKSMVIKVLTFNVANNHLSKAKKEYLSLLFQEAKYYYNYLLYHISKTCIDDFGNLVFPYSIYNLDIKDNSIEVFNSSSKQFFYYHLKHLSSQMKSSIVAHVVEKIKILKIKKELGYNTGQLKFKSQINIPLMQYGSTYHLDDDLKYLRLQSSQQRIRLYRNKAFLTLSKELGFSNFSIANLLASNVLEMANAQLKKSAQGYVLYLTIYINPVIFNKQNNLFLNKPLKNKNIKTNRPISNNVSTLIQQANKKFLNNNIKQFRMNFTEEQREFLSQTSVGIDAGISEELILNFGELKKSISINSRENIFIMKVLEKIKEKQNKLNHFIKLSKKKNNGTTLKSQQYFSLKKALNKLWEKYSHIKDNMVNHIVSFLRNFKAIYFQNENVQSWHNSKNLGFSQKIQHGILGKVYAKLRLLGTQFPKQFFMLPKNVATTKTCVCGKTNKITLSNRIYKCMCGYNNSRDTHAAFNMGYLQVSGKDAFNLDETKAATKVTNKIFNCALAKLESPTFLKLNFHQS